MAVVMMEMVMMIMITMMHDDHHDRANLKQEFSHCIQERPEGRNGHLTLPPPQLTS